MFRSQLPIAIALTGLACHSALPPDPPPSAAQGAHSCPLGVPGIATIDDTPDGATFTFTTSEPSRVADLRQRARDAAASYGSGAHRGKGHDGVHGLGQHHGLGLADIPPLRTSVDDVANGARIRISAIDLTKIDDVRSQLHERAERVASGECP